MTNQPAGPLVRDIHRILEYEVQFSGTFALSMVIPGCPNPGLDVDGVGRVALPLTDQTAKVIASVGDQAPYGHGMDTIVDTAVRDTIQIDASKIHFANPKWTPAIQKWVEGEVWSGLGCAPFTSPPRCEPYKLLLYKPGAHFLPHRDTEKAPGMFATLVVILPSEFTGGEIHVSHGGESKVFDNAKDSAFETTILAWYTDVTHEVKEITSGYRFALSYHLIDTSPGINPPHLPGSDSSLQHLRGIFSKWSNDEYPSLEVNQAVAYGFTHLYSDASLQEGILKGKDHHIASVIKHAGDTEGVLVLMGWLNVHVEGWTGDDGWQTYQGRGDLGPEYGPAIGTHDSPVMSHVNEANMWVDGIRDMQGKKIEVAKIELDCDSILPYRAFSGVESDESKLHKGYWGNEGATVEFTYKRAALVMFPKEKQLSLMLSAGGAIWALKELERSKSEGPSKENREIIDFLARQERKDVMATILKIAIEWNDAIVWGRVIERNPKFFLEQNGYKDLYSGWQAFKFDGVRQTFEKLFQERGWLQQASIRFLLFVKEKLPFSKDPQKDKWISTQATRAMETFDPDGGSNSGVMDVVRWKGLHFASSVVLPRFHNKRVELGRIAGFAIELIKHTEELIALPQAEGQTANNAELLDHILDEILLAAIPRVFTRRSYDWPDAVSSLLSICIPGKRMKAYGDLLDLVSCPSEQPFYNQYLDLYTKMIPNLVKLLREHGIDVSSSPSRKFFRYIIGMYLQDILGSREGSPFLKFSMLTCGHEVCSQVNDFLRSEETRMRVEIEEDGVKRCVTGLNISERYRLFECRGEYWKRPPCMELTKNHEALAAQHWSVRLADAQELLKTIGMDEEISRIMGERYSDVEKALEGSQAFVIAGTQRELETEDSVVGIE